MCLKEIGLRAQNLLSILNEPWMRDSFVVWLRQLVRLLVHLYFCITYVQTVDVVWFVYACLLYCNVASSFLCWVLALIVFIRIYCRWLAVSCLTQLECIVYGLWMYLFGHSKRYCTLVFSNHNKIIWKRRYKIIKKKRIKNSNRKNHTTHISSNF